MAKVSQVLEKLLQTDRSDRSVDLQVLLCRGLSADQVQQSVQQLSRVAQSKQAVQYVPISGR